MDKKNVEVTLKLPVPFYRVLEAAAWAARMTVEAKIMQALVVHLDCELAQTECLAESLCIEKEENQATFQNQLRKMAGARQTAYWNTDWSVPRTKKRTGSQNRQSRAFAAPSARPECRIIPFPQR